MWVFEHVESTSAAPAQVWDVWSRPREWREWDHGLREVTSVGPFDVGSRGTIRPVSGPRTTFVLTDVEPGRRFATMSPLPLATLVIDHRVEAAADGARFAHRVTISGALGPVFGRLLGRRLARELPESMQRLAVLAEGARPEHH